MKPTKTIVPLADAEQWNPRAVLLLRKYDGSFAVRNVRLEDGRRVEILGELMRPVSGACLTPGDRARLKKHGRFFAAFRLAGVDGEDWLCRSNREAWSALSGLMFAVPHDPSCPVSLAEIVTRPGAVLDAGGEGVCAHVWDAPWGQMLAVKAREIFTCRVTRTGETQSVMIEDAATGAPRGNVPLRGGKCDQVRPGSIIRVEGMGLTGKGLIRQPQPCTEWLVQE